MTKLNGMVCRQYINILRMWEEIKIPKMVCYRKIWRWLFWSAA